MKLESSMKLGTFALVAALMLVVAQPAAARPIRYTGFVISDVTIGQQHFTAARVYISFDADTSTVVPFTDGSASGFMNSVGRAHVRVISGNQVIAGELAPNQIFVYFDIAHASVGFGSFAGGRGYPLSLTANQDLDGLVENSLVGAVSDILVNGNTSGYTAATTDLAHASDLTKSTTLSGGASSCVAFDPVTSVCSNFTPLALQTSAGPFLLFEPYSDDQSTDGTQRFTINWGVFWASLRRSREQ